MPGELGCFIDEASVVARENTIGKGGLLHGQRTVVGVFGAARQRPDLAVRGRQLPEGRQAAGLRPALLELRLDQPARPVRSPGTCATCTWRTTCACRASCRCAASRSISAASTCRPSSSPRARTTSCRGRPPTSAATCSAARRTFVLGASRPHRRRHQSGGEEQAQPLDQRQQDAPIPTNGWRRPPKSRAAGGRAGPSG